jgi:hypothetical protein
MITLEQNFATFLFNDLANSLNRSSQNNRNRTRSYSTSILDLYRKTDWAIFSIFSHNSVTLLLILFSYSHNLGSNSLHVNLTSNLFALTWSY